MVSVKIVGCSSINLDDYLEDEPTVVGCVLGMIVAAIPVWMISLTARQGVDVIGLSILLIALAIVWFPIAMILPLKKTTPYFKVWWSWDFGDNDTIYIKKTDAASDVKAVCQAVKELEQIAWARVEKQEQLASIASKCK
jgi:hypothetical protein